MNLKGSRQSTNVVDKRSGQSNWDSFKTQLGIVGRNIASDFTSGDPRAIKDISASALSQFGKAPQMKKKNPFTKAVKG
ncbi:MAG TPA: hypothetical protein VIY48_05095 [Candidatus Paceibacterota bacterium]